MPAKGYHAPKRPYQVVDDIYFYKERTGNGYYLGNIKDETGKAKPVRIHVYVWEKHNGKVPVGYHVHHIDGNVDNNSIDNLKLLKTEEHLSAHGLEKSDVARKNIKIASKKATEWHKSEEGAEWHKEHYAEYAQKIWNERVAKICVICGKEYETNHASIKKSKYCSNSCKEKARRLSGIDNETRVCSICGQQYVCNKYSKQIVCGNKECANESQRRKKTGKPRPVRSIH